VAAAARAQSAEHGADEIVTATRSAAARSSDLGAILDVSKPPMTLPTQRAIHRALVAEAGEWGAGMFVVVQLTRAFEEAADALMHSAHLLRETHSREWSALNPRPGAPPERHSLRRGRLRSRPVSTST